MEFRVSDMLKLPSLKDAIVLSGKHYLYKVVKGSTIMEAPDITDWLKGGELILTSLYPIRDFNEDEQKEFIAKLAEKEISAFVVKNHRFVDAIPQTMIEEAEKRNLPIIQIPKEIPYVDIMYPVMEEISNNQLKKLQYYKEIHDRFTALALADEKPEKIIQTLEELIGNPVALFDRNFFCMATTLPTLETFQIVEKLYYNNETKVMKFPHYRQIVHYEQEGKKGYQIVVPIETINHINAYLLIGELNKPLAELDFIAVENAANALSLEFVKQFAVAEVDKRFKNDLLEQLLEGKIHPNSFYHQANLIGWDIDGSFAVVLFKVSNENNSLSSKQNNRGLPSQKDEMLLLESIQLRLPNAIVGRKSGLIVVLWKINKKEKMWMTNIKDTVNKITQSAKKQRSEMSIQSGIGTVVENINDVSNSYKKALDALELGEILNGKEAVTAYDELGIFRLLCQFDELDSLKSFIPIPLQKLLNYPQANKADLLITLKTFLQCNQNATKTAQLLFIHHKTAVYRLERIKEITGMNFDDPEEMLSVQIGLKIIELLEREKMNQD